MRFPDVLPAALDALRRLTWLDEAHTVTLIRDLRGRVRVVVETPNASPGRTRPGGPESRSSSNDSRAREAEEALRSAIGEWLSDSEPVWIAPNTDPPTGPRGPVLAFIRAHRRRLPGPSVGGAASAGTWFLMERHAGRRGWVHEVRYDPPWSFDAVDAGRKPAILTFFSHKGGLGRSTALAACAMAMARAGLRVVVVDLDLEAPGIHTLFGLYPVTGVLDFAVHTVEAAGPLLASSRMLVAGPDFVEDGAPIHVLAAGSFDDGYLEMLARIDLQAPGDEGPGDWMRRLLVAVGQDIPDADFILLDARAGFHEVGGVALAGLGHGAVVFGTDTDQSWFGLRAVARVLAEPVDAAVPLFLVHAMGPPAGADGEAEERGFRERAYDVLSECYYPEPPDPADTEAAHFPSVIRWTPELRGRGGQLTAGAHAALRGLDYQHLADRLVAAFRPAGVRR